LDQSAALALEELRQDAAGVSHGRRGAFSDR